MKPLDLTEIRQAPTIHPLREGSNWMCLLKKLAAAHTAKISKETLRRQRELLIQREVQVKLQSQSYSITSGFEVILNVLKKTPVHWLPYEVFHNGGKF